GGTTAFSSATDTIDVTVSAVNDAPVNQVPGAQIVAEDTPLAITGLSVNDVDGNLSTTQLSVSNGTLSVSVVGGAMISAGANGTGTLTLSGTQAQINAALSTLTYQGTANYNGADLLTVASTDSNSVTDVDTVAITVTAVNDAPTDLALSANQVAENAANGTVVGTVTGTDPDVGDTKTYSFTDSAGGRFAINSSTGQITVANSSLLDYETATSHSVTVRVTDSGGLTYDETFTINLTNVNEAPTGADAAVTIAEDTSHTLTTANFGFSDVDAGDSLSAVRIDSLPSAGSLTLSGVAVMAGEVVTVADITAGNLVFTPAADANGTGYASFTFSVRDSNNAYDTAPNTLTVNVTPVNDAPVNSVPGSQTVAVDTPLVISGLSVSDVDGNLMTVQLSVMNGTVDVTLSGTAAISSGANGTTTLTLTGTQADINTTLSSLIYQGNSLFTGTDTLTVLSTDGNGATDSDSVQISVSNNAPTNVLPAPQTAVEDQPLAITGLSVTDADGNLATVQLSAVNGTLTVTLSGGATVSSGTNGSNSVTLTGSQTDLNATLASLTYQGNPNFAGLDSFTITSTDSTGTADTDSLPITVTPVNDSPSDLTLMGNTVAENAANGTVVGTVTGTDPDVGDTKTYSFTDSAGGRFAINSSTGQITVANSSLLDYETATSHSVTVRVTDSGGLTYDETFTINLTNVNEAPTGADAAVTIAEDTSHTLTTANFGFSDVDAGDSLSAVRIDSLPSAGSLTLSGVAVMAGEVVTVADITAGNLVFTPAADANGTGYASFTFSVRDSGNLYDSGPNTLTFDVTPVNDAPVNSVPGAQSVAEDTPLTISGLSVTDVDGNLSTVQLAVGNGTLNVTLQGGATVSAGSNGSATLTLSGSQVDINATLATLSYQGILNFDGSDLLTITSTDSNNVADVDTVAITVTAVNDATVVTGGTSGTGAEDTAVTGTLTATDADGLADGTVFTVTTGATQGTASIDPATGLWSYTPNADYNGTDSFTVTITDDAGNSSTQVISVTVTPVGDITNDSLTTNEDTAISANVLTGTNGATADSFEGTPVLTSVTQGAHGSVTFLANGTVTYTPNANYNGPDSFTYTITSGGVTETATVNVTVTAVNDTPVNQVPGAQTLAEDTPLAITGLSVNDVDGNLSTTQVSVNNGNLSVSLVGGATISAGANGTGTLTLSGTSAQINAALATLTYQGILNYNGADLLTMTSTDSNAVTDVDTVAITVTPANDAPVLSANTGSTVAEGGTDTIDASELAVADVEQTATQLTYVIGTGPAYGRLELTTAPGISATTFTQADIAANRLIYIHNGSETTSDSFTFTVSDGAGGSIGTTTVTLTITPVNDTPTITSGGGGATAAFNVAENVSAVTIVTGADVDVPAQALTYSISGGVDQARFTINAATGTLNFAAPPDFEVATDANGDNVYVVQVQVIDSQGASTTQTIQVTVTDVVESVAPPPPPSPPSPTVPPILLSPIPPPPIGGPAPGSGTPPPAGPTTPGTEGIIPMPVPSGPTALPTDSRPISQGPLTLVPSSDRPLERVAEEPRKPMGDIKDRPLFLVNDDQGRPLFSVLPVEPTPTLEPDPPETKQSVSELLLTKLDEMTVSLEHAANVSHEHHELIARITAVTGTALSVGFIAWALRSGALVASLLATMPAWQHFDPLPVVKLSRSERTRRRDVAAQDQQQEAEEFKGLKRVLDEKPPLKRTA
ncbi:MAG: tandem-95 repeat protein, partial [Nitrospiraceae bacterium]|nr:tandem-95 repeat protein [Nitrospiraceae bacterium]